LKCLGIERLLRLDTGRDVASLARDAGERLSLGREGTDLIVPAWKRASVTDPAGNEFMEFELTAEDAEVLRHLASIEPIEARSYLQDRPELAQRMTSWPPEIRIEVCRIIYRSFSESARDGLRDRQERWSDLIDLLDSTES
jgi:hypothetical protein